MVRLLLIVQFEGFQNYLAVAEKIWAQLRAAPLL